MNREIDLHGCTENQALMRISTALHAFLESGESTLVFITGKGNGVLRRVLEDFLDREGWRYRHENNNPGSYVVFKGRR